MLIYDPKISDSAMVRLLEERAKAGVDVRIIGKLTRKSPRLEARKLAPWRLHTRTMIRDGNLAFVGSQSLRGIELDMRREIGIIFRDAKVVGRMVQTFCDDWHTIEKDNDEGRPPVTAETLARKVAKLVAKELPAVAPVVDSVVKDSALGAEDLDLRAAAVEETVKDAVKEAVRDAVKDVVAQAVCQANGGEK